MLRGRTFAAAGFNPAQSGKEWRSSVTSSVIQRLDCARARARHARAAAPSAPSDAEINQIMKEKKTEKKRLSALKKAGAVSKI